MTLFKKTLALACSTVVATLLSAPTWAGIVLSIDAKKSVITGQEVKLDIFVDGLNNSDLGGFNLDVGYDNTVFSFTRYTLGKQLVDPLFGQQDASLGSQTGVSGSFVNLAEVSGLLDFSAQPERFLLGSIYFKATQAGSGLFRFMTPSASDFSDALGGGLNVDSRHTWSVSSTPTVAVSEPSTAALLSLGLLTLVGLRRRF